MKILVITFAEIAAWVSPVLSGAIMWILARKKNSAEIRKTEVETDGLELNNLHLATKIWKDMVRELQVEVNQLRVQVQKLSHQVLTFSLENTSLKEELESLQKLIKERTNEK